MYILWPLRIPVCSFSRYLGYSVALENMCSLLLPKYMHILMLPNYMYILSLPDYVDILSLPSTFYRNKYKYFLSLSK